MKNNRHNRILVISTEGNIFNNPSLKCIIDLLIENGFSIDLRYPKTYAPTPLNENVHFLPYGKLIKRIKSIIFNRFCSQILANLSVFTEFIFLYKNYDLIICIDRQGLLEGNVINRISKTPYVFISFEIMFESETSTRFKLLEKNASKNLSFWIIQDEVRAKILEAENNLQDLNKVILPLASAGEGSTSDIRLRDQLGVPEKKNVAIVIGSVASWSMTSDILQSVESWPDDWALIVNERYGRARELLEEEPVELKSLVGEKVFISDYATEMVDDMSSILSGVDVGLAFYQPDYSHIYTGDNIKYLGLASGKISTYLRYGIPVISNEIGLYADEIRKHKIGYVVNNPSNISEVLNQIKISQFKENAYKYFSRNLDFNLYAKGLLGKMLSIIETGNQK